MIPSTVMYHITRICSEKCTIRQFCHCVNITECTYTDPDGIDYCTPRLYGIHSILLLVYESAQHVTVQNDTRLNQAQRK